MHTKKSNKYGLLGKDISYSFSGNYFSKKFEQLNLEGYTYENFDFQDLSNFNKVLDQTTDLKGMKIGRAHV